MMEAEADAFTALLSCKGLSQASLDSAEVDKQRCWPAALAVWCIVCKVHYKVFTRPKGTGAAGACVLV